MTLGPATLYRTLKELLEEGLIETAEPPADETDGRRKYYRLTPDGVSRLRRDLAVVRRISAAGDQRLGRLDEAEAH